MNFPELLFLQQVRLNKRLKCANQARKSWECCKDCGRKIKLFAISKSGIKLTAGKESQSNKKKRGGKNKCNILGARPVLLTGSSPLEASSISSEMV